MTDHEKPTAPARGPETDRRTGSNAAAARISDQVRWVDLQVSEAMRRGEFDDLPGAGKPLDDLGDTHDPDWWLKKLIEREKVSGVLPAALQLRKDDLELNDHLDRLATEREVRAEVEDFNRRIRSARMQLEGGPPVVTPERDVEAEVAGWRERRQHRWAAAEAAEGHRREQKARGLGWLRRRTENRGR